MPNSKFLKKNFGHFASKIDALCLTLYDETVFFTVGFVTTVLSDRYRFHGVMVSTLDFECKDRSSNLGETLIG